MKISKHTMDISSSNIDLKQKIQKIQQNNNDNIVMTQFFNDYEQIQKKLKEQDIKIKEQQSTIHDLMQEQGLEDKYTMLRRQLLRSEMRCVSLKNKLIVQETQTQSLLTQIHNLNDSNEALKIKNDSLNQYLRSYEIIIQEHEKQEKIHKNNNSSKQKLSNSDDNHNNNDENNSNLCISCQNKNNNLQNSFDLNSSLYSENLNVFQGTQSVILPPQKSQSQDGNMNGLLKNSKTLINMSKSTYLLDQKRSLDRSNTTFNNNRNSSVSSDFYSDILLHRSKTVKSYDQSDDILNDLNIRLQKKLNKFQDCAIYEIDESYDQQSIAIVNAKSDLKIFNQVLMKESQQLSNINTNITESIKFSSNKNILLQGGQDKNIHIYQQSDLNKPYQLKMNLPGHNQSIKALQFFKNNNDNINNNKIISGSLDQTMRIWDITNEKQLSFVRTGSMINALDCKNYSDEIITGHNDGSIKMYRDKNHINTLYIDSSCITSLQVSNNDNYIIATNSDGLGVYLVDIRMMQTIHQFTNLNYLNTSIHNKPTFALDDKFILAGSNDGDICNHIYINFYISFIDSWKLQFALNFNMINVNKINNIVIWSVDNLKQKPSVLKGEKQCTIHSVLYSKQSENIYSTDSQGNLNIWNVKQH